VEARKRPAEGTVDIGGAVHRAELHLPALPLDGFKLVGIPKQSDPRQLAEAQRLLSEGVKIRLDMSSGYVVLRSATALVRAAYLMMFRTFGYRYVLDPGATAVRAQIATPVEETRVLKGVSWRVSAESLIDTSVAILTTPSHLQSFIVFLRLDRDPDHVAAVVLPRPGVDGAEFFEGLADEGPTRTCRFSLLPPRSGFMPMDGVWNYVVSQRAI
jgi:hypothetical protein